MTLRVQQVAFILAILALAAFGVWHNSGRDATQEAILHADGF